MNQLGQNYLFGDAPVAANSSSLPPPPPVRRKRKRPEITDDDEVEVIALSVEEITSEATQFTCEFCSKSFNRVQNLQLHRRAHNLPCTLKNDIKNKDDKPKVYVCPETTCANHIRCNALGDLTSMKKHYKRKHSEKTFSCPKCFKKYAVEADLRAHLKTCGTKEYKCDCGAVFSRRDSYRTHRTLCDALIQQSFSMENNFPSLGNLFEPNISDGCCLHPSTTPALNIGRTTASTNLYPYLHNTIQASACPSLQSSTLFSNPYHLRKITATDSGNTCNAQLSEFSSDDNFDIDVLYDRLFAVSSAPTSAFPQDQVPQQGYTLANHGNSASFTTSMKNPTVLIAAGLEKNNSHIYPNFSSATGGNSFLPVFASNSGSNVWQNGGPSGIGGGQFNQEQLRGNNRVGGNADFPELQNDFCWGY